VNDKEICVFGSKIGEEQSSEDAEDGPPELLVCSALFVAMAIASINQGMCLGKKF